MKNSEYMDCLELAGRMIMESGGETYRAEETVLRMGEAFGLRQVQSFAVPSGVFISFRTKDGDTETAVVRVRGGETDLNRVNEVNAVSRRCASEQLSAGDALRLLREIDRCGAGPGRAAGMIAAALSSAGFAWMFGGGALEAAIAFCTAAIVRALVLLPARVRMTGMAYALIGSFLTALLPMAVSGAAGLGVPASAIAGALMPLLPGVAMTNAIQDMMRGDMISGTSHAMRALLTAVMVAGGALIASSAYRMIGGAG